METQNVRFDGKTYKIYEEYPTLTIVPAFMVYFLFAFSTKFQKVGWT
jgi:hypothetical protein